MSQTNTQLFTTHYDERLQVDRPYLRVDYDQLTADEQAEFELLCQKICAQIPSKIEHFEQLYMKHFDELQDADDDHRFYQLTEWMNELSSRICDLNLLFLHIEGKYISQSLR